MAKLIDKMKLEVWYGAFHTGMKIADLHVHTTRSDGWWQPERLAEAAVARGLDAIAITDHDDIRAGFEIADYVARRGLPLIVFPGAEISARDRGRDVHIVGINLRQEVRPWQSLRATVDDILAQDAIPVIPHGKSDPAGSPGFQQILDLELPVAIEVYNATTQDLGRFAARRGESNEAVLQFYREHGGRLLGAIGGTDAHFRTIGRGLTGYEGDLLDAIRNRQTVVLREVAGERLMPWDLAGYGIGLKRLARRRRTTWGPDRPDG